tara:strand:- start:411 stop:1646 length:1236 start_codon:yes stop_codon:yes gene_type:complete
MNNMAEINSRLFDFLKGHGLKLTLKDSQGNDTLEVDQAERFFSSEPNIMVTVDPEEKEVKFSRSKVVHEDVINKLHSGIKEIAHSGLYSFKYKIYGKNITPKHDEYKVKSEVTEASLGKMYGSTKTSYQPLDAVKIVVRHTKPVNEEVRGSRSRQISKIFIQRADERFALPHKSLAGARAMARHVHNGGNPFDQVGHSINEMVENITDLSQFVRYVDRKGLVNEENNEYVQIAKESISTMRQNLKQLSGAKSYAKAVDTIDAMNTLTLSEDEQDLSSLFTEKHVDNTVQSAFPSINRLVNIQRSVAEYIENSIENNRFSVPAINEDAVEFPNKKSEIAHKLNTISESIDDKILKEFINNTTVKILKDQKLDEFTVNMVKKLISKVNEKVESNIDQDLVEFVDFTEKLNKIC